MYNVPIDIMRVLIYNNIKIRNQKTNAEGNTMTYFKNITTLEELRKEYKKLVKQNHPDNGGSAEVIKVINVEYEIQFKILEKSDTFNRKKYNQQEDEMIRDIINVIIHLNIDIERSAVPGFGLQVIHILAKMNLKEMVFTGLARKKLGTGIIRKKLPDLMEKPQWQTSD